MDALGFFSQKYLIQISFVGTKEWKINKITIVLSTFKIDIVPLFFLIFYSLAPKIEICLNSFLDKNPPKQPLCGAAQVSQQLTQ